MLMQGIKGNKTFWSLFASPFIPNPHRHYAVGVVRFASQVHKSTLLPEDNWQGEGKQLCKKGIKILFWSFHTCPIGQPEKWIHYNV